MSKYAIQVEGLGKEYIIGGAEQRHDSFREMLTGSLTAPFRRLRKLGGAASEGERFWALQDVSFNVEQGEVLGIIGRNGAGKSTLLKVLSRITSPTTGRVVTRGRMASLLEVGTGFHPELTGRENIYLNGAILGMSRIEIDRQFEEIVNFAEINKFLDTPVKRYSSGMYVRLAFSVAAHLDVDILVVDEVLAVGDADFQRKCLGKMKSVSSCGRTVLFVSHNMNAVQSLCGRVIVLDAGRIKVSGPSTQIVDQFLADVNSDKGIIHLDEQKLNLGSVKGQLIKLENDRCGIRLEVSLKALAEIAGLHIDVGVENAQNTRAIQFVSKARGVKAVSAGHGDEIVFTVTTEITALSPGEYFCTLYAYSDQEGPYLHFSNIRIFNVGAEGAKVESVSKGFTALLMPEFVSTLEVKPQT